MDAPIPLDPNQLSLLGEQDRLEQIRSAFPPQFKDFCELLIRRRMAFLNEKKR